MFTLRECTHWKVITYVKILLQLCNTMQLTTEWKSLSKNYFAYLTDLYCQLPNIAVKWLTFLLRITEVPGSNIGPGCRL
jgi:hypothetical protein